VACGGAGCRGLGQIPGGSEKVGDTLHPCALNTCGVGVSGGLSRRVIVMVIEFGPG
jgi:hypothetical protein